jgi:hypothetical protein
MGIAVTGHDLPRIETRKLVTVAVASPLKRR